MCEKPFAKQREGRWGGVENDCFCTIAHVHPEATGGEVADWGLTHPLAVPEELDPDRGVVPVVDPLE